MSKHPALSQALVSANSLVNHSPPVSRLLLLRHRVAPSVAGAVLILTGVMLVTGDVEAQLPRSQ